MSRAPLGSVLGVDTALRCSGVGVVEGSGSQFRALTFGVIKNKTSLSHTECLLRIHCEIRELIEKYQPVAVAIEGVFFCKNAKTALVLGQARGAVLTAAALNGLPVYEYAPRLIKQSVTGVGRAHKAQVAGMVSRMLGLKQEPSADAADALAVALTHLHQMHLPPDLRQAAV
jgi:crossover junction endodeoxyribonuclease RuvC